LIGQDNLDIFFDEDDELSYDEVDQVTIDDSVRNFRLLYREKNNPDDIIDVLAEIYNMPLTKLTES